MSIGHLYVLFGEFLFRSFAIYNWVVFLVLSFISSLYILDINPLLDVLANMFSNSVGCLFLC